MKTLGTGPQDDRWDGPRVVALGGVGDYAGRVGTARPSPGATTLGGEPLPCGERCTARCATMTDPLCRQLTDHEAEMLRDAPGLLVKSLLGKLLLKDIAHSDQLRQLRDLTEQAEMSAASERRLADAVVDLNRQLAASKAEAEELRSEAERLRHLALGATQAADMLLRTFAANNVVD